MPPFFAVANLRGRDFAEVKPLDCCEPAVSDIFGKVDGIEPCKSLGSCGWTGCDDCATRVDIGPVWFLEVRIDRGRINAVSAKTKMFY